MVAAGKRPASSKGASGAAGVGGVGLAWAAGVAGQEVEEAAEDERYLRKVRSMPSGHSFVRVMVAFVPGVLEIGRAKAAGFSPCVSAWAWCAGFGVPLIF